MRWPVWTVERHSGNTSTDPWVRYTYLSARLGHDAAEDLARRRFESIASSCRRTCVVLRQDGQLIEVKFPPHVEEVLRELDRNRRAKQLTLKGISDVGDQPQGP